MVKGRKPGYGRASRAKGNVTSSTPMASASTASTITTVSTPLSSVAPSTNASDVEHEISEAVKKLAIGSTALETTTTAIPRTKARRTKIEPFRFLDLPSELRIKVYEHHFANAAGEVLDLDPDNYKTYHQRLAILRTCRTIYREAMYYFYSTHPVRVFPCHWGRHFKTKKPLLARLKPGQRACITTLDFRLGPGWSDPPPGWVVKPILGLDQCTNVTKLTIYAEIDPSDPTFKDFRRNNGYYTLFTVNLLNGILDQMPWIKRIEFDAWTVVKKSGALMQGLIGVAEARGLRITWGPDKGWTDGDEVEPPAAVVNWAPLSSVVSTSSNIVAVA
ncbi:hypothetical protein F5Y18DRAFT_313476 [Xylariaceae sp. FL1019]|nr:hypothetical protein F5Y18DRAFT_313476 [Xylariaceae sp. FL1019]